MSINKSIWTSYFTDEDGQIISVRQLNEEIKVSPLNFTVQLQYLPEEFNRVTCLKKDGTALHEVNDITSLSEGCFYVDYNTGRCTFSSDVSGEVCIFNYYGIGYELLSASRIFDQASLEADNIVKTLQDIIDAGREGLDYLQSVGDASILLSQLQRQVTNANTSKNELQSVVTTGTTLKEDLTNKISTGNTLKTGLGTVIGEATTTKAEIDKSAELASTKLITLNSAINIATSTNTTLKNTNNSATTTNSSLANNITKGEELIEEIEEVVASNGVNGIVDNINILMNKRCVVVSSLAEFEKALANIGKLGYSNTILFRSGSYSPTKSYELPSNTHIGVLGDGTVTFNCSSTSIDNIFRNKLSGSEGGYDGAKNITIDGIVFNGYNTTHTMTVIGFGHSSNCCVRNCTFLNFNNWHNIEINGSERMYIEHNTFKNYGTTDGGNPTEAVQIDFMGGTSQYPWTANYDGTACSDIYIENNLFWDIKASAIGNHTYGNFSNGIYIRDNKFYGCTTCVSLGDCNCVTFNDNTCELCQYGICQLGSHITSSLWDWKAEGNKFLGMRGQTGFEDSSVENRFIRAEPTSQGYCINRFSIKNNTIMDCNSHGIGITANYLSCNSNIISSCGKIGIFIYGCSQGTVNDNLVSSCGLSNVDWRNFPIAMGGNTQKGCWGLIISGNTCIGGEVASLENVDANCIRANNLEV